MKKKKTSYEIADKNKDIINSIFFITFSKVLAQLVFFLMRYILLLNWLDSIEIADLIIYYRYVDLFLSLNILGQFVFPKFLVSYRNDIKTVFDRIFSILTINIILLIAGFSFYFIFFKDNLLTQISSLNPISTVILFLIGSLAYLFQKQFEFILLGLKKPLKVFYSNVIFAFLYGLFAFFFVFIFKMGLLGSILSYFLSNFFCFLSEIYFVQKIYLSEYGAYYKFHLTLDFKEYTEILRYSIPLFSAGLLYFLNYRVNTLFINRNEIEIIIYFDTSLSLIIYLIGFIGAPIQDAIFPSLVEKLKEPVTNINDVKLEHNSKKKKKEIQEIIKIVNIFLLLMLITPIIAFFCSTELIYSFLYPSMNVSLFSSITRLLLIGSIFYILNQFYGRIPAAKGKSKAILISQALGALVNLCFLFIYRVNSNILFLIFGFIFSTLTQLVYYIYEITHISEINVHDLKFGRIIVSVAFSVIMYLIFSIFIKSLIITTLLTILGFFLLILSFKIIPLNSFKYIFGYLKERFKRF